MLSVNLHGTRNFSSTTVSILVQSILFVETKVFNENKPNTMHFQGVYSLGPNWMLWLGITCPFRWVTPIREARDAAAGSPTCIRTNPYKVYCKFDHVRAWALCRMLNLLVECDAVIFCFTHHHAIFKKFFMLLFRNF
jgi:hypothetical protein